jgi:hypothetical protein
MLDPASTTPVPPGFPIELRPLLGIVIALSIAHTLLRMRRKSRVLKARRASQTDRSAARAGGRTDVIDPREATLPDDPAAALARLRGNSTADR